MYCEGQHAGDTSAGNEAQRRVVSAILKSYLVKLSIAYISLDIHIVFSLFSVMLRMVKVLLGNQKSVLVLIYEITVDWDILFHQLWTK